MKILITGGCGFLGSNLASSFLDTGDEVIIVDALYRMGSSANLAWLQSHPLSSALSFYQLDITDNDALHSIYRLHAPFDFICHVAGQVAMTTSLENPRADLETNIIGTFNVLEATRSLSPRSLVAFSSTNKVYGDLTHLSLYESETRYNSVDYPIGLNEGMPLDFSTPYGCSKGSADQYVRDWSRVFGLKTVIFRHSSIYGGRQFSTFDQGWIGWFCKQALNQKAAILPSLTPHLFSIAGNGKQVRDVLHATDLVSLYRSAYDMRDNLNGEIFNIGGGIDFSLSLLELFSLLSDILAIPPLQFTCNPRRTSDQDFFVADISKATQFFNWRPTVTPRMGITRYIQWLEESQAHH